MTQNRNGAGNNLSDEFFHNIFHHAGDGIFLATGQGEIIEANPRGCELLGFSREELIGRSAWSLTPPDETGNVLEKLELLTEGKRITAETILFRKDGARLPVEITAKLLSNGQLVSVIRDISKRKLAEQTLIESEQKFRSLVENSPYGIMVVDEDGRVVEWNQGLEAISNMKRADVLGKPIWEVQLDLLPQKLRAQDFLENLRQNNVGMFTSSLGSNEPQEVLFRLADGTTRNVEVMLYTYKTNAGYRMGGIMHDITRRKQIEMLLKHLAMHDGLTDLPNRQLFQDRLELAIERHRREKRGMLAVMMLDLDKFKQINDTYGHAFGDQLLQVIARRLQDCLRKSDTAARLGGDEFAIISEEIFSFEGCERIAQKVLDTISMPMEIEGHIFSVNASIGISLNTSNGQDATSLLRQADLAMYAAKQSRNCYRFYDARFSPLASENNLSG